MTDERTETRGTDRVLDTLLVEYKSLREESLNSIGHRLTVVSFTLAALSVLLAGLLAGKVSNYLAGAIAFLFVPALAMAALTLWLAEYHRSTRAGASIRRLEGLINTHLDLLVDEPLPFDALSWETDLKKGGSHFKYPYVATAVFTLGVGGAGTVLGVYLVLKPTVSQIPNWASALIGLFLVEVAVTAQLVYLRFFVKQWRLARDE